ncbi:MAG TPA: DUF6288 domain-containing protein [Planctomycetota bacterium]
MSATVVLLFLASLAAAQGKALPNPDFTKGGRIPEGADHDWNLGATGARGWMHSDKLCTTDARQIAVTKVDQGSPAEGILAPGDVLLGVGGKPFAFDPRTELGRALTRAEAEGGRLLLSRWRAGRTEEVVLTLPVLGAYGAVAPYDCPKSRRILEQGCRALARRMSEPSYKPHPIPRSLNALALLAGGDPAHLPLVQREARWAAEFSTADFKTWSYGYVMMLIAEYAEATGDESARPGLRRLARESAEGQSAVGSWGHTFARPDGRLNGYGMMNAPGLPLTIGLVMARNAGVKDPEVQRAVERSLRLLRFYMGKGAIPYGDHAPWTETHEDNGKCGMGAVLFNLVGEAGPAAFFARMSLASHGAERDGGHTGNFFNMLWAMPALALQGPRASGAWMEEFGAWSFDLARRWDGTFVHQGPPEPDRDSYAGWDATGAFLLAYAQPLKKTVLTGKRPGLLPALETSAVDALIADGRGWSNKDRHGAYDRLEEKELLHRLGSWSPIVRERAAMALARRKSDVLPALIEMLRSSRVESGLGACAALAEFKAAAAAAVPALRESLNHPDLWLRVQAAEALAAIGPAAMAALPDLLRKIARAPTPEDPRGMEQRFLCFALFDRRGGLLKGAMEGVDRDLLREAVRAGLQNEDGRARGSLGVLFSRLSFEEIKPLLPAIHQAIVEPAPSGEMFADGVRLAGLDVLSKHRIREGIPLCLDILEIDRWGKQDRIKGALKSLEAYGAAAKPMLPRLRQLEKDLLAHREAKNLKPLIEQARELLRKIEGATGDVELRDLR